MSASRSRGGLAALVAVAALAVGCDDGSVKTPPPPPLAEGHVDTGPPSAIKASGTPSRRIETPPPRSAINSSLKADPPKSGRGSR